MALTTPLFVYRGETMCVLATALSNTEPIFRFKLPSALSAITSIHLTGSLRTVWGNPQHHRSMCKAPGMTMTLTTVWVFYGTYGKVGKSHTVKYEQLLCFMVTLLLFVTFRSVDKKKKP